MPFAAEQSAMPSGMLSTVSKNGDAYQEFDLDIKNRGKHIKNNKSDSPEKAQNIKPKIIMR